MNPRTGGRLEAPPLPPSDPPITDTQQSELDAVGRGDRPEAAVGSDPTHAKRRPNRRTLGRRILGLPAAVSQRIVRTATWPLRRFYTWRVERKLAQRLKLFESLEAFSADQRSDLSAQLVVHERVLSRVDFSQELCAVLRQLPRLLLVGTLFLVFPAAEVDLDYSTGGIVLAAAMAYLVSVTLVWRAILHLLPPPNFDPLGSRHYRHEPWRIMATLALAVGLGLLGYEVATLAYEIVDSQYTTGSQWLLVLAYVGMGLFFVSVVAVAWVLVRFLSLSLEWILEYTETFTHPQAVLIDNHLAMLYELERQKGNGVLARDSESQHKLIQQLEVSARCMEQGVRRKLRGHDPETDEWVRSLTGEIASALRAKKKWVIAADSRQSRELYDELKVSFKCAIEGAWTHMPRRTEISFEADSRRAIALRIAGTLVLVGLPLVLALSIPSAASSRDEEGSGAKTEQTSVQTSTAEPRAKVRAQDVREDVSRWDGDLQLIAGVVGSILLLMTRLDDIVARVARRRRHPLSSAAAANAG